MEGYIKKRIEGHVNQNALRMFKEAVSVITEDLKHECFDEYDIEKYLVEVLVEKMYEI